MVETMHPKKALYRDEIFILCIDCKHQLEYGPDDSFFDFMRNMKDCRNIRKCRILNKPQDPESLPVIKEPKLAQSSLKTDIPPT